MNQITFNRDSLKHVGSQLMTVCLSALFAIGLVRCEQSVQTLNGHPDIVSADRSDQSSGLTEAQLALVSQVTKSFPSVEAACVKLLSLSAEEPPLLDPWVTDLFCPTSSEDTPNRTETNCMMAYYACSGTEKGWCGQLAECLGMNPPTETEVQAAAKIIAGPSVVVISDPANQPTISDASPPVQNEQPAVPPVASEDLGDAGDTTPPELEEPVNVPTPPVVEPVAKYDSAAAAIAAGAVPANDIVFHTSNEGCEDTNPATSRPYLDWSCGQYSTGNNPDDIDNSDAPPHYGFAYNTGAYSAGAYEWYFTNNIRLDDNTSVPAKDGSCSLAMKVSDIQNEVRAVRIFKIFRTPEDQSWCSSLDRVKEYSYNNPDEPSAQPDRHQGEPTEYMPDDAYFSLWFYFPEDIQWEKNEHGYAWWNIFQFKDRSFDHESLSTLSFNAGVDLEIGESYSTFKLFDETECGTGHASTGCSKWRRQAGQGLRIPTKQWVHFEVRIKKNTSPTNINGIIQVWQDGVSIFDLHNVKTQRDGVRNQEWSVNNYGARHKQNSHTLYVDDVLISKSRISDKLKF